MSAISAIATAPIAAPQTEQSPTLPSIGEGFFATATAFAIGTATVVTGDAAGVFEGPIGRAIAYNGSRFKPIRLMPSWQLANGVVSFNKTDVPLVGSADDSRQVLMGLLQLWEDNYKTMMFQSKKVQLRYEPKNVMPPTKGDNFVWVNVVIDVAPANKEVVEE